MRNKRRGCVGGQAPGQSLVRTTLLALGLLAAVASAGAGGGASWPTGRVEVLGEVGSQLEASMQSSVLSDIQETTATIGTAPPAGIPDSSAVVGQVFQLKVPKETTDDIVKVTEAGKEMLPPWLEWDSEGGVLQGLPLEADRGVHYISVSVTDSSGSQTHRGVDVFSIEVHPEEHAEVDGPAPTHEAPPFACGGEEPVTVLTVILDADLTKLSPRQRVGLLSSMQRFSGVPLPRMRVLPVVNNRLFDMSAFMAGPGNAKKVVENGALLSWKLGCALDPSRVPDISGVQAPAKEGTMSALLGYPVVGWHIANKKPHTPRRVRRQLYTPTPVPSLLPPTTYPEPPVRIVPTPTSPHIAPSTDHSAPPVRGPVPLPMKPTIRMRDPVAHTPTLGPPQPTRVLDSTSILSIQPTATRPIYVEATASPTPPPPPASPKPPPPPRGQRSPKLPLLPPGNPKLPPRKRPSAPPPRPLPARTRSQCFRTPSTR
ncbi:hypothetical protein AGOR_G00132710 [Albula goreensis]|uniref:Dystroglycan-type cadherin-like domain-containing protein n=1 Tax=Albula goreensis TaxID=1534307 RepID=A0A8T3D9J8_9TELE|nr:hypothetical protein AGOR_G00132710 [Albula goreensis]